MIHLFKYNWKVRDSWLELCCRLSQDELIRDRTGGVGSILKTFFHIIDVEYSWIQAISGKPVQDPEFKDYMTMELIIKLSRDYRLEIKEFINDWSNDMEYQVVTVPWMDEPLFAGEVLRHVIAHEIHHIGQLSIWARELGVKPISANFIGRGLMG